MDPVIVVDPREKPNPLRIQWYTSLQWSIIFFDEEGNEEREVVETGITDTGSKDSIISESVAFSLKAKIQPPAESPPILEGIVKGTELKPIGFVELRIESPDLGLRIQAEFWVVRETSVHLVIGHDIQHRARITEKLDAAILDGRIPSAVGNGIPDHLVAVAIDGRCKKTKKEEAASTRKTIDEIAAVYADMSQDRLFGMPSNTTTKIASSGTLSTSSTHGAEGSSAEASIFDKASVVSSISEPLTTDGGNEKS